YAKRLVHVYNEIKRLETEFRCGKYYPDLLDEQIVIIREELRLILAESGQDQLHVRTRLSRLDQIDIALPHQALFSDFGGSVATFQEWSERLVRCSCSRVRFQVCSSGANLNRR